MMIITCCMLPVMKYWNNSLQVSSLKFSIIVFSCSGTWPFLSTIQEIPCWLTAWSTLLLILLSSMIPCIKTKYALLFNILILKEGKFVSSRNKHNLVCVVLCKSCLLKCCLNEKAVREELCSVMGLGGISVQVYLCKHVNAYWCQSKICGNIIFFQTISFLKMLIMSLIFMWNHLHLLFFPPRLFFFVPGITQMAWFHINLLLEMWAGG